MSGENLTPITRKEMFLAKAAGQDVETPEPITREEMFLSMISGGGGGGGSGGSEDWYITDAQYLFYNGARLDVKDTLLSKMKDVTSMYSMFSSCNNLTSLDVSKWDTSKVTNMSGMFGTCSNLTSLDVSKWDTSNVTTIVSMFHSCNKLTSLDVSNFDTSNVTAMSSVFSSCNNLTSLDVSKWDTSKVTNMSGMFGTCSNLTSLDVSKWDTSNVTTIVSMFHSCNKLTSLDVSNFDTSNVTDMSYMFDSCRALEEIVGFSATNKAGLNIGFPKGKSSSPVKLKRLTFRTDLASGVYSIRSAINISYCSFERDGMVEMFNTLPDVSGLGLSSSYTTITITGNPCLSDLTAEDEAIATSKGWTLVK